MTSKLKDIQTAIENFQMEEACQLLREELQDNPTAETYYLASKAAPTHGQRIKFLEQALELDPFHEEAAKELETINATLRDEPQIPSPEAEIEDKPKQPPTIQLASITQRFFAFFIDSLIIAFITLAIWSAFGPPIPFDEPNPAILDAALSEFQTFTAIVNLIISVIYYVYFVPSMNGQTPGKRALGIRIVKVNGNPMTILDVLLRHVIGYNLSSIFGLGFIWAIFDRNRQGWHDKIVNTAVIVDPK